MHVTANGVQGGNENGTKEHQQKSAHVPHVLCTTQEKMVEGGQGWE